MKQTPESNLSYRANTPKGTGAITTQPWQNVPPVVVQQAAKRNGGFPWGLLFVVGGLFWISSMAINAYRPKTAQERSAERWVQSNRVAPQSSPQVRVERAMPRVERALPVNGVPRAEAVVEGTGPEIDQSWFNNPVNLGKWVAMTVPGEGSIWAHWRGTVSDASGLPSTGQRWDWYRTPEGHSWIYMPSAATGQLGWLDP
jgi:hypothetical protein